MIAFSYDAWLRERQEDGPYACWTAILTDGATAFSDDGRPGAEPPSAWLRLAAYCRNNRLGVRRLGLRYRDRQVWDVCPPDCPAYYFARGHAAVLGGGSSDFFLFGALTGQASQRTMGLSDLTVYRWAVPELGLEEVGARRVRADDPLLIVTP